MQDHVKIIGILWVVFGCFSLIGAMVLFLILFGVSFFPHIEVEAATVLRIVGIALASFLALFGFPKIIGGIGLLKGHEWARILILVVSFLSLLNIPFGTALGVYSIVILLNKETAQLFHHPVPGK
jgi:hypothetical protein